ncbi:MAG: DMT family transporter [Candidatus Cloacimonadales bacterium]|nr:DMT family transporter [Candidatus Cloacimonadales bacterium]
MKATSVIIGLLAGLLFGVATPFSKIILSQLNSFQLAGLLYLGAAFVFVPFIIKNRKVELKALQHSSKKKHLVGTIIFGGILGPLFLMMGLKTANAMSVSIWLNLELVATAFLGMLFFKDHLDRYAIMGVLLTLCAGIIISVQESSSGILSGFFIILACISWGFDNHFTAIIDGISPQTITFIKGLFGGITNLTIGLILSNGQIQINYIPLALLIGIFSYGISIVLYVISAQNLGATRSQILFSTAPFWGIFAAYLFLSEPLSLITIIAVFFLISGIVFTNFASHKHEHLHKEMHHIHLHDHDDGHHGHAHTEGDSGNGKHSHIHEHEEKKHKHTHYPDLHHRHDH